MVSRAASYNDKVGWWRSISIKYWHAFPEDRIKVVIYHGTWILSIIFGGLAGVLGDYARFN
ncbi:MAG: hypothetical protein CSA76_04855, partial [Spirochaetales bacterium]